MIFTRFAAAVLASWIVFAPTNASAGACCVSATAWGVGRLQVWEDFAFGLELGYGEALGRWDGGGVWQTYGRDYQERELRASAWTMVRLSERLTAHLRLPWLASWRETASLSGQGRGFGDMDAGIRWQLVDVASDSPWPAFAFTFGVIGPTGRPADQATASLAADATGRGIWAFGVSLNTEHVSLPWYGQMVAGLTLPLGRRIPSLGTSLREGPTLTLTAAVGRQLVRGVVLSALATWAGQTPAEEAGKTSANSGSAEATLGVSLSWLLVSGWSLQATGSSVTPVDGVGNDRDGMLRATLGLRWVHAP